MLGYVVGLGWPSGEGVVGRGRRHCAPRTLDILYGESKGVRFVLIKKNDSKI